jgi:hypothetical protein
MSKRSHLEPCDKAGVHAAIHALASLRSDMLLRGSHPAHPAIPSDLKTPEDKRPRRRKKALAGSSHKIPLNAAPAPQKAGVPAA